VNLAAVDALEVHARDAEVRVLALDHDERDSLVRHLDRVRMSQLVRREPTSDARRGSCVVQLLASSRGFPMPSGRRSVDDAKQCADGKWMA